MDLRETQANAITSRQIVKNLFWKVQNCVAFYDINVVNIRED